MSFRSKKKKKAIDTVGERLKITGGETRRPSEMQVPMGKDEVEKKKKKGKECISIRFRLERVVQINMRRKTIAM